MADYKHEIDLLDSFNADVKYIKKLMLTILDEVGDIPKEFESTFKPLKKMTDKIEYYGLELVGGIVLVAKFGISFFSVLGTLAGTLLVWCSMSLLFKIVSSLQKIEASVCNKPLVVVSETDSSSMNKEAKTDTETN